MILIIFGLAGAGKTYAGKVLSEHLGFYHQDADQWLPEEMQSYIEDNKIFTLAMLDNFTKIMINSLTAWLQSIYPSIQIFLGAAVIMVSNIYFTYYLNCTKK